MTDDELVQQLRVVEADRREGPPAAVLAAARAAFTWRTIDEELALLAFDSTDDDRALAGVRGDEARLVSFAAGDLQLDIEIAMAGGRRALTGEATPPPDVLELQRAGGASVELPVDGRGRFRADDLVGGPIRFRAVRDDRPVVTVWVTI